MNPRSDPKTSESAQEQYAFRQVVEFASRQLEQIATAFRQTSETLMIIRTIEQETTGESILVNIGSNFFLKLRVSEPLQDTYQIIGNDPGTLHYTPIQAKEATTQLVRQLEQLTEQSQMIRTKITEEAARLKLPDPFSREATTA